MIAKGGGGADMVGIVMRAFARVAALAGLIAGLLVPLGAAWANTSHAGWPPIQHLYINKTSANATVHGIADLHNELLGGNGNDTLYAGDVGDVLWGDYMPGTQSTTQVDKMYGGPGNDIFYASHGTNLIYTGGGSNIVHAHYGRGTIHCGSTTDIVYLSHKSRPDYKLIGCRHISYATQGS
jgi:Ca2+-binding RTX toxin-like protein